MKALIYLQSNFHHTLFIKHKSWKITTLIVNVDDMVVTKDDSKEMEALQKYLPNEFEKNDLG